MGKILVCQHVPYEILGTFNPLLKEHGFRLRYVNFGRTPDAQPKLDGYQGLVILGGPMCLDQSDRFPHLKYEMQLIEQALRQDIPVLGICLGAQLMAKTLGAWVGPNQEKEIGWYNLDLTQAGQEDPVLRHLKPVEKIFQWHGDTFTLPQGAVHLASSSACTQQAFRYGNKSYALQFHLEVDEPMIERWLQVPGHVAELAALQGKIDPKQILRETPQYIGRLKELSRLTFGEFLKTFGFEKKYRTPPSR
jgi:GMP synthase (glutamine-hydrolysing)